MIPSNALVNQLEAYIRTVEQPLVQVVDALTGVQRLFSVGEMVRALVQGELPDGRFAVKVKDQLLDLNLPRNTQSGTELEMRVIANSPRLAFLVSRQALAGLPPEPLSAADTQSTRVALGETAQFLGDLIADMASNDESNAAARIQSGPQVLFEHALTDTATVANTLRQIFSGSGLFYESHLAEWVAGARSFDAVAAEPQARVSAQGQQAPGPTSALPAGEGGAPPAAPAPEHAGAPQPSSATMVSARPLVAPLVDGGVVQTATGDIRQIAPHSLESMQPAIRDIVQQQLQVLDQRPIVWTGQAWPGQTMRWEVEEDRSNGQGMQADEPNTWNTRIHLDLPTLGSIDAVVNLSGRRRVGVSFTVARAGTASLIKQEGARLKQQLEAAGLELAAQQVALGTKAGTQDLQ